MHYIEESPLAEVHRIRAEILKEYGGMQGWHEHLTAQRPRLEREGWHFAAPEELEALKRKAAE